MLKSRQWLIGHRQLQRLDQTRDISTHNSPPKNGTRTSDCIRPNCRLRSIIAMNKEISVILEIMRPEQIELVYDICEDGSDVAGLQELGVV